MNILKVAMTDKTAQQRAQEKYIKKRFQKVINFNTETESDLIAIANSLPDFSRTVKEYLRSLKGDSGHDAR